MLKFRVSFYFGLITLALSEELANFTFRCVNEDCAVPIKEMKARIPYNPDHELKRKVHKDEVLPIVGVSAETNLLLVQHPAKGSPFLVPNDILVNIKSGKEQPAKVQVSITLPRNFALTKRVRVLPKNLIVKKLGRESSKSDLKLRLFLRVVFLNNSISFFEEESRWNSAAVLPDSAFPQGPRVTYGENPFSQPTNFMDNSTGKNFTVGEDVLNEVEYNDGGDESIGDVEDYFAQLSTNDVPKDTLKLVQPPNDNQSPNNSEMKPDVATAKATQVQPPPMKNFPPNSLPPSDIQMGTMPSTGDVKPNVPTTKAAASINVQSTIETIPSEKFAETDVKPSIVDSNAAERKPNVPESEPLYVQPTLTISAPDNIPSSATKMEIKSPTVDANMVKKKPESEGPVIDSMSQNANGSFEANETAKSSDGANNVDESAELRTGETELESPTMTDNVVTSSTLESQINTVMKESTNASQRVDSAPTESQVEAVNDVKMVQDARAATLGPQTNIVTNVNTNAGQMVGSAQTKPQANVIRDVKMAGDEHARMDRVESSATLEPRTNFVANMNANAGRTVDSAPTKPTANAGNNVADQAPIDRVGPRTIPVHEVDPETSTRASNSSFNVNDSNSTVNNASFEVTTDNETKAILHDPEVFVQEQNPEQELVLSLVDEKEKERADEIQTNLETFETSANEPELVSSTSNVIPHFGISDHPGFEDVTSITDGGPQTPSHSSHFDQPVTEMKTNSASINNVKDEQSVKLETTEPSVIDEKPFYSTAIEYLSSVPISVPNFSSWFAKNEAPSEYCSEDQDCDGVILHPMKDVDIGLNSQMIQIPLWGEVTNAERQWMITYVAIFSLIVFLATVMLSMFKGGQWKKREKHLVAVINRLEGKLLVSTKEISTLEEQINNVKTRPVESTLSAEKKEAIKEAFNRQLKQYQDKNSELEDKVTYLEKELESVSNYALEMHKLFENSLTTQSTSRAAIDEVDELRMLTESQENKIEDLRREMESIIIENQILKETSENAKSLLKKLEQDYNVQMKKNLEMSEKQKELAFKLEKETDNNLTLENEYKSQMYQLRSKLEEVEMKLRRSEIQVEEMNQVISQKQDDGDSDTSIDDVQLRIQLSTLEAMNNELSNQLKEEKSARRMVEEHMGTIIKELNNLKKSFEVSEKERNEAVTKLQVLADYFNNEKTKMHRELEAKEKLLTENESKDQLLSRTMQLLKEEINNYKLQNEALKKEISEQEVSYKIQLAKAEQKGRDDWFAFRKIERKYKECQQEAASLRNRILTLESNTGHKDDERNGAGMNGDLTVPPSPLPYSLISPDMLPLPSEFIPPPTPPLPSHPVDFEPPMPPLFSPDERLPPLGGRRVPSPPNSNPCDDDDDDEFTPPPPIPGYLSNRSRNEMPSSYMKTPPTGRHRSSQFQPRRQRNSVDSPSSGMSMESLDKSTR